MLVQKNKSEKYTISNNEFWNGVLSFCKNAKEFIKRNKPERLHIFYSGPAEGAFVIGQYAKEFYFKMVTSTEFESVNAAVKGQCVKPLHQLAK